MTRAPMHACRVPGFNIAGHDVKVPARWAEKQEGLDMTGAMRSDMLIVRRPDDPIG